MDGPLWEAMVMGGQFNLPPLGHYASSEKGWPHPGRLLLLEPRPESPAHLLLDRCGSRGGGGSVGDCRVVGLGRVLLGDLGESAVVADEPGDEDGDDGEEGEEDEQGGEPCGRKAHPVRLVFVLDLALRKRR